MVIMSPTRNSRKTAAERNPGRSDDAHAFIPDPSEGGKLPDDDLSERLGEEFIEAATSGEEPDDERLDAVVPEEIGGPFVETTADEEIAFGTDPSNPQDAMREPLPRAIGEGPAQGRDPEGLAERARRTPRP